MQTLMDWPGLCRPPRFQDNLAVAQDRFLAVMLALIIVVCIAAITTLGNTPIRRSRRVATLSGQPAKLPSVHDLCFCKTPF
jgi:hypothetical protein